MNKTLFAIDENEDFESPIYCFGLTRAYQVAAAMNDACRGDYQTIAKVRILPNGAFEYYDIDSM